MITLKDGTSLVGARCRKYNFPIETYDDGDGPVWMFGMGGHSDCPGLIIRARSFELAYEIAIDEAATIPESEVPEAYGFYGEHAALELRHAVEHADAGAGEYPELVDGYEYQSNASGTGIVNVGHYAWLREMKREDCDDIRLVVRDDDHDDPLRVRFELESYAFTMTVNGKSKRFHSFSLLSDVGERLRRLERVYHTVNAERVWVR